MSIKNNLLEIKNNSEVIKNNLDVIKNNLWVIKNNSGVDLVSLKNNLDFQIIVFYSFMGGVPPVLKSICGLKSTLTPDLLPNLGADRLSGSGWLKLTGISLVLTPFSHLKKNDTSSSASPRESSGVPRASRDDTGCIPDMFVDSPTPPAPPRTDPAASRAPRAHSGRSLTG